MIERTFVDGVKAGQIPLGVVIMRDGKPFTSERILNDGHELLLNLNDAEGRLVHRYDMRVVNSAGTKVML
jgi:hypothetical protein